MRFLRWLWCRLPRAIGGGHLRGKATGEVRPGNMKVYQCPRCLATWTRKVNGNGGAQ